MNIYDEKCSFYCKEVCLDLQPHVQMFTLVYQKLSHIKNGNIKKSLKIQFIAILYMHIIKTLVVPES